MELKEDNSKVMAERPMVSVCVQTYQHVNFIRECLDSILMQQTDFPFEIILGEDESTDGTREICIEYADKYPDKIRLFLRSRKDVIYINGNATGRFNLIENLKAAKGKYIALCEGDDYWTDPLKLQKQVDFLEKNPAYSGCFHQTQQISMNGTLGKMYGKNCPDIMTPQDTIDIYSPFHTSSFLFRRDSLTFPVWFKNVTSGDMALFSIVSANGPLKKIEGVMSVYRKHEGGLTATQSVLNNYHLKRIELMLWLDEFHHLRYTKKVNSVIEWHKRAMSGCTDSQIRQSRVKKYIAKISKKLL